MDENYNIFQTTRFNHTLMYDWNASFEKCCNFYPSNIALLLYLFSSYLLFKQYLYLSNIFSIQAIQCYLFDLLFYLKQGLLIQIPSVVSCTICSLVLNYYVRVYPFKTRKHCIAVRKNDVSMSLTRHAKVFLSIN